jgi:hypothetical protein
MKIVRLHPPSSAGIPQIRFDLAHGWTHAGRHQRSNRALRNPGKFAPLGGCRRLMLLRRLSALLV